MKTVNYDSLFDSAADSFAEAPARSYRRAMKPRLPRKASSSARIELNRFWNELEEFYDRCAERRAKNNNNDLGLMSSMPAYTTDVHDHDREDAENRLNEAFEARYNHADRIDKDASATIKTKLNNRLRLESSDVLLSDAESVASDGNSRPCSPGSPAFKNNNVNQLPSPPPALPDFFRNNFF